MIQGHDQFTDTHLKINTKWTFLGSICKALYVVRRRRKSHSPHGQTVRLLRLETALKSGPPPSMAEMHRKVRHSKTSAECKTAARPHQSRCSTQPEGLMRFQCRAFHRLTNAGKQGIVLVSGIFFASDHHGGIGVLNAIQNG